MTYAQFLAVFLGVPVLCLIGLLHRQLDRRLLLLLAGISLIATAYTAPWDNLIVVDGVWSYHPHQIAGIVIGHVPLEEYVFYTLQVFLTGMLTAAILFHRSR